MFSAFVAGIALSAIVASQAVPTPAPTAKPASDKRICRSDVSTGSIMAGKTCHTQAEWDRIDGKNRAAVDRLHDATGPGVLTTIDR